jgi:hypothetical protein
MDGTGSQKSRQVKELAEGGNKPVGGTGQQKEQARRRARPAQAGRRNRPVEGAGR